jgi:hypothetical protein
MMNSNPVDTPRRKYMPPVLTRRTPSPTAGVPPLMPPFIARRNALAWHGDEVAATAPLPVEASRSRDDEAAAYEKPAPLDVTAFTEPTGDDVPESAFTAPLFAESQLAGLVTGAEASTHISMETAPAGTEADGAAAEEPVTLERWEPEALDEVWDPTDLAEPTAAADDAAEWPLSTADESSADDAWWVSVPREAAAVPQEYAGETQHDEADLQHVADRVAARLEELAQDIRRRGLAALTAGMPEDERLRFDELSKLIAAVIAGFYGHEE